MKHFLIHYLRQQPDWLRVSIPDLVWFLNTPEKRIRELIEQERVWTGPRIDYPPHLVARNADQTPYYVYKYQIIQLVHALGIRTADHPADFHGRMDLIRSDRPAHEPDWKFRAICRR